MPAYDASRYDPPAPVAIVSLCNPDTGETLSDNVLLLDTGADITLLPRMAVEQIGIYPIADVSYELMAFDGSKSSAVVANLDMILLNRRFRGRYVLIDADQGILGRDVLNHLSLHLDGPGQQWQESK